MRAAILIRFLAFALALGCANRATVGTAPPPRTVHEASGIVLVRVPAGGVIQNPFYLGETEVTVGQFRGFVEATGYVTDAERGVQESGHGVGAFAATPDGDREWSAAASWRNPFPNLPDYRVRDDHPVVHVSWNDAQRFVAYYGLRLPSEAEWEHAARAGGRTLFPWGDSAAGGAGWANVADAAAKKRFPSWNRIFPFDDGAVLLSAAGAYRANPWGLRDMTGNVWEWCQDAYRETPSDSADAVQGDSRSARVQRGCSWLDAPDLCRSDARAGMYAYSRRDFIGFRVAM